MLIEVKPKEFHGKLSWFDRMGIDYDKIVPLLVGSGISIIEGNVPAPDKTTRISKYGDNINDLLSLLVGQTVVSVETENTEEKEVSGGSYRSMEVHAKVVFSSGMMLYLGHNQDCCESFGLDSGEEELHALVGQTIQSARAVANPDSHPCVEGEYGDTSTWTFIDFQGDKTPAQLRFIGSSNGYYSESCDGVLVVNDAAQMYLPVSDVEVINQINPDVLGNMRMFDLDCQFIEDESGTFSGRAAIPKTTSSLLGNAELEKLIATSEVTTNECGDKFLVVSVDPEFEKDVVYVSQRLIRLAMLFAILRDAVAFPIEMPIEDQSRMLSYKHLIRKEENDHE